MDERDELVQAFDDGLAGNSENKNFVKSLMKGYTKICHALRG